MDFRDYTYVQMIAQYKTISRAADALYISQPSLSKFLQKLEEELGTPLFKRVNKQMYPTYAGERFLETGPVDLCPAEPLRPHHPPDHQP